MDEHDEFGGPHVCPLCGRVAGPLDWRLHPTYGYRLCPTCQDEDGFTVIPRQMTQQERSTMPPAKPETPAIYGYSITYVTNEWPSRTLSCHYVGTEKTARRKTLARRNAKEILTVEGLTEAQYVSTFGRGRM